MGKHKDIAYLRHTSFLLSNFRQYPEKPFFDYYWFSNQLLRKFLVFLFPAIVAIACYIKLMELVPMEIDGTPVVDWTEKKGELRRYK